MEDWNLNLELDYYTGRKQRPVYFTKNKVETFEDVQNFLRDIRTINAGGCGIAAYSMYLWLKKNEQLPEDFKIVYLYRSSFDEKEYQSNLDFLAGRGENAFACVHAIVHKDGKYLDSKGDFDISRYSYATMISPEQIDKFMQTSLNAPRQWNTSFDREDNIPLIEEALGIDLSMITKYFGYE